MLITDGIANSGFMGSVSFVQLLRPQQSFISWAQCTFFCFSLLKLRDATRHSTPVLDMKGIKSPIKPEAADGSIIIPQVPVKSEQIGLDNFNLLRVIGRGSYAKVFQVEYKPTCKIYAMKVIKKEIITDEEVREAIANELQCAIQLTYSFFVIYKGYRLGANGEARFRDR